VGFQNLSSVNVIFKYNSVNSSSSHFLFGCRRSRIPFGSLIQPLPVAVQLDEIANRISQIFVATSSGFSSAVIEMIPQIRLFGNFPSQFKLSSIPSVEFKYSALLLPNSHFIRLNLTNSFCFTAHRRASSPFTRLLPFMKQSALSTIRCRDSRVDDDQLGSWDASLHP
jgi:hypothetical protein